VRPTFTEEKADARARSNLEKKKLTEPTGATKPLEVSSATGKGEATRLETLKLPPFAAAAAAVTTPTRRGKGREAVSDGGTAIKSKRGRFVGENGDASMLASGRATTPNRGNATPMDHTARKEGNIRVDQEAMDHGTAYSKDSANDGDEEVDHRMPSSTASAPSTAKAPVIIKAPTDQKSASGKKQRLGGSGVAAVIVTPDAGGRRPITARSEQTNVESSSDTEEEKFVRTETDGITKKTMKKVSSKSLSGETTLLSSEGGRNVKSGTDGSPEAMAIAYAGDDVDYLQEIVQEDDMNMGATPNDSAMDDNKAENGGTVAVMTQNPADHTFSGSSEHGEQVRKSARLAEIVKSDASASPRAAQRPKRIVSMSSPASKRQKTSATTGMKITPVNDEDDSQLRPEKKVTTAPKTVEQMDLKTGNVIYEYPSIRVASRLSGVHSNTIHRVLQGVGNPDAGGYFWRFKGDERHPGSNRKLESMRAVEQLCLETGNVLASYECSADAKRALDIPKDSKCIKSVCDGKGYTAHGFFWRWRGACNLPRVYKRSTGRPVEQLCIDSGKVLASFESQSDAKRAIGVPSDSSCIKSECDGKGYTAHGYFWRNLPRTNRMGMGRKSVYLREESRVGPIVRLFESATEAGTALKFDISSVCRWCREKAFKKGFLLELQRERICGGTRQAKYGNL
jgi:hypothetical protein